MAIDDRTDSNSSDAPFGVNLTKRYVSVVGELALFKKKAAGSGSVELVDYMGGDGMIARVATAGHPLSIFKENPSMGQFIEYLAAGGIRKPFKHTQLKFNMQMPIEAALLFVYAQECSVNEYSGRYSTMLDSAEDMPAEKVARFILDQPGFKFGNNDARRLAQQISQVYGSVRGSSVATYKKMLDLDFARELARSGLGINNDTKFFWKIDLASLHDFVDVQSRCLADSNHVAMPYLEAVAGLASNVAPVAWAALDDAGFPLSLTMPSDDEIVDPPLLPAFWQPQCTRRVVVKDIEDMLFVPRKVLDQGQIQPVDYMGDDNALAEAARVSYGQGTVKLQENVGLVRSLIRDEHTSPIEMAELAMEYKAPIFSDPRQLGRHRTHDFHGFMGFTPVGSRYYFPDDSQFKHQDRLNRQGRGKDMDEIDRDATKKLLSDTLEMQAMVARELRQLNVPEGIIRKMKGVSHYTRGSRTADANNWIKMFKLRSDAHAQYEIRAYSYEYEKVFKAFLPSTYQAARDYVLDAVKLSSLEQDFMRKLTLPSRDEMEKMLFAEKSFTMWIDKDDHSKGRKLNREAETFLKKLTGLMPPVK